MLLNLEVRAQLKDIFSKELVHPVNLKLFSQAIGCESCQITEELLKELAEVEPEKIKLNIYSPLVDKEISQAYQIERVPTIVIEGDKDYGIRYIGLPAGLEFTTLVQGIVQVSKREPKLSERTVELLKDISLPMEIMVFVTTSCGYCPSAAITAMNFALANDNIKACDVGDRRSAKEFVEFCVEKLKKMDLLVNNASVLGERKSIKDYPEEVWEEVIRVNINGVFYITKYTLPYMSEGSVIVNMSSGAGKRPAPYWGAYAVSKFGVEGFSLLLAEELKEKGIRVYALNPGATRTQMRAKAYPQEDPNTLKPPEKVAEFMLKLISSKVPSGSYDYKDIRDV